MTTVSKNDVDALVREIRGTRGYTCELNGAGHWTVTAPGGDVTRFAATPSDPNWRVKTLNDLKKKVGWTPGLAEELRKKEARLAMAAVRAEETESLRKAQALANERQAQARKTRQRVLDELTREQTAEDRAREIEVVRAVATEELHAINVGGKPLGDGLVKGYPTVARYVTLDEMREAVDLNRANRCNTRPLYPEWIAKWKRAMLRGAWYVSPEAIVFDQHGCLVDGMHRGMAYIQACEEAPEVMVEKYPDGGGLLAFTVVTEFPSALVRILNGGKSRSPRDVLGVAGVTANAFKLSSALRLAVAYDTGLPWTRWNSVRMDNDEITAAVEGPYARLTEQGKIASRLARKVRMVTSTSWALPFLLERDGHDPAVVEEFFNGLCLDVEMPLNDPRGTVGLALLRRAPQVTETGRKKRGTVTTNTAAQKLPGAHQLGLALKAYYKWNVGDPMEIADFGSNEKAYSVWAPGMRRIGGQVRIPYAGR